MKLLMAIVRDDHAPAITSALNQAGMAVTHISSTGGFWRRGNTTLLIGVEDDGSLAIYSGVPGEVGPVPLHAVYRRSVVTYDSLSPSARTVVDERRLRDREDAMDVSRQLGMWP